MIATTVRGVALLMLASSYVVATAQDWPHWRGPNYDGSVLASDLPTDFDTEKHVRWKVDLPGPGASTPIVVGDQIFLTTVDTQRERLVAMCLSREDGSVLWQADAGSGYQPGGRGSRTSLGRRSTYASPSPTTDGERVVFFFGNGDLVSYTLDGEEQWRRNVQADHGDFAFQWTFSSSPTIWDGVILLPVLQRDVPTGQGSRRGRGRPEEQDPEADVAAPIESFLLGINPANGKTLYRHVRACDALMESRESYATPIPLVRDDGTKEFLIVGGDVITGHAPKTGEELWRWGTWNDAHRERWWRLVPSPVVAGDVALVCAPKRAPVYAVKLGGAGTLGTDALAWRSEGRPNPVSSDVPTPAVDGRYAFVLSDVGSALSKIDATDGRVLWTTELSKDYLWRASPTVADGKVWCMNHGGEVVVVDAESGDIVHSVAMGEEDDDLTRSVLVIAHNQLFVRTNHALYCIGK